MQRFTNSPVTEEDDIRWLAENARDHDSPGQHQARLALWSAVFTQATSDAFDDLATVDELDKEAAGEWFVNAGADFREVCGIVDHDPERVLKAMQPKLEAYCVQRAEKVAARAQAIQERQAQQAAANEARRIRINECRGERRAKAKTERPVVSATGTDNAELETAGVSLHTYRYRRRNGMTHEEALSNPKHRKNVTMGATYTVFGETMNARQACERYGLNKQSLAYQLKMKGSMEEAVMHFRPDLRGVV